MYKILFIESGDYLYETRFRFSLYSVYEITKRIVNVNTEALVFVRNTKEEIIAKLMLDNTNISDSSDNIIYTAQNLNLFEIVEA